MSRLYAGSVATTLLADHGAEVIKIEHPDGDDLRNWGAKKDETSLWWKVYSRNKKLISIDFHYPEGREILKRLILNCDVLVENFRPGVMEKWGFSYDEIKTLNPKMIMARISGFGQRGYYKDFLGFGTLAEAMSGFANLNGYPDGPPTLPPMALADALAGIVTAFAIAASLFSRQKTGKGEMIDTTLYEPLMWILGPQISEYQQLGITHYRRGNQSNITVPRNLYRTSDDKWIAISASAQSVFERLAKAIELPDLVSDPHYATNSARLLNRKELDTIIADWATHFTQDKAVEILRRNDVAVAPIYDTEAVFNDIHFNSRGSITEVIDEQFGKLKMQGIIPKLLNEAGSVRWAGKRKIGEDTIEILLDAGYTRSDIDSLNIKGVIKYCVLKQ